MYIYIRQSCTFFFTHEKFHVLSACLYKYKQTEIRHTVTQQQHKHQCLLILPHVYIYIRQSCTFFFTHEKFHVLSACLYKYKQTEIRHPIAKQAPVPVNYTTFVHLYQTYMFVLFFRHEKAQKVYFLQHYQNRMKSHPVACSGSSNPENCLIKAPTELQYIHRQNYSKVQ